MRKKLPRPNMPQRTWPGKTAGAASATNPRRPEEEAHYQGLIFAEVYRYWQVPAAAPEGMRTRVRVRLTPDGEVHGVEVIESSGDEAFDRSAIQAVRYASPLPVPPADSGLAEHFRVLDIQFRKKAQ